MTWHRLTLCAALLLAAGCQTATTGGRRVEVRAVAAPDWQATASTEDADRLGRIAEAWTRSLAAARAAGFGRRIAAEGALLEPGAALPRPQPTPGAYMCRLVRIGGTGRGAGFAASRPVFCFVGVGDGNRLSITRPEGSERPAGYLWDDERPTRMIFLGSLAPGVGGPVAYGEDRARDAAGIFERIGDFRFRLVVLSPEGPGRLDVFELVPAARQGDD